MFQTQTNTTHGKILFIPTPIGNLEDMTLRALKGLESADIIAAEDTRHTRILLSHYKIDKPLTSFFAHNEKIKAEKLTQMALEGKTVAMVSDAGMPGISDPAFSLVQCCLDNQVPFEVLPGATAFAVALVGSGLSMESFSFWGFLPSKTGARKKKLEQLQDREETLLFYEAPHRIVDCLADMLDVWGNRTACTARELTKVYEEWQRGSLESLLHHFETTPPKGEFVLCVSGAQQKTEKKAWQNLTLLLLENRLKTKQISQIVSDFYQIKKKMVYDFIIAGGSHESES